MAAGAASMQSGNFSEAISHFEAALSANPNNAMAAKNMAVSYVSTQRLDEALPFAKTAAASLPQDSESRYILGFIYASKGHFAEAIPELDACLAFNSQHIPARQALVHSLIGQGKALLAAEDWRTPDAILDRAHKLDKENPAPVLALIELYHSHQLKQKVLQILDEVSPNLKQNPEIVKWKDKLKADPLYAASMRQAAISQQGTAPGPAAAPAGTALQKQIPCPGCKRPIMEWAAICPHCGHQNRAVGQFAGRAQNIPATTWQEGAYMVVSILYTINAIWALVSVFMLGSGDLDSAFSKFFITLAAVNVGVGLGLIFKVEWIMFFAKILCYISIIGYFPQVFLAFGLGQVVAGLVSLIGLGLTCFMIYLINYNE